MFPTGVVFQPIETAALSNGSKAGLKAEYFNNAEFKGNLFWFGRHEVSILIGDRKAPAAASMKIIFRFAGPENLPLPSSEICWDGADGPVRILVDGELYSESVKERTRNVLKNFDFIAGRSYDIRVEIKKVTNSASANSYGLLRQCRQNFAVTRSQRPKNPMR